MKLAVALQPCCTPARAVQAPRRWRGSLVIAQAEQQEAVSRRCSSGMGQWQAALQSGVGDAPRHSPQLHRSSTLTTTPRRSALAGLVAMPALLAAAPALALGKDVRQALKE